MPVSDQERADILEWATWKALDDAKKSGRVKPEEEGVAQLEYNNWLKEKIWHYEKLAYYKIQKRQGG